MRIGASQLRGRAFKVLLSFCARAEPRPAAHALGARLPAMVRTGVHLHLLTGSPARLNNVYAADPLRFVFPMCRYNLLNECTTIRAQTETPHSMKGLVHAPLGAWASPEHNTDYNLCF